MDQAWRDVGDYVRETYRLSRRMIRHRRDKELTASYKVAGRSPTFVILKDPSRLPTDEVLEMVRLELDEADAEFFQTMVLHGLAGGGVLVGFLKARLGRRPGEHGTVPATVRSLAEDYVERMDLGGAATRLGEALRVVKERVGAGQKVVVCSSFSPVAHEFAELAHDEIDTHSVYEHFFGISSDARDHAVANFLSDAGGEVLIADRSMEEGRNLQEASVLVNLDLPLDANRLDQRIGRLDRYSSRPDPAEVIVLRSLTAGG